MVPCNQSIILRILLNKRQQASCGLAEDTTVTLRPRDPGVPMSFTKNKETHGFR